MRIGKAFDQRTEFHIGVGVDRYGQSIVANERERAISSALLLLTRNYGGASVTRQEGAWVNPRTGDLVVEPGITLAAYGNLRAPGVFVDSSDMALALAREFRQACVIVAEIQTDKYGFHAWEVWDD